MSAATDPRPADWNLPFRLHRALACAGFRDAGRFQLVGAESRRRARVPRPFTTKRPRSNT